MELTFVRVDAFSVAALLIQPTSGRAVAGGIAWCDAIARATYVAVGASSAAFGCACTTMGVAAKRVDASSVTTEFFGSANRAAGPAAVLVGFHVHTRTIAT